MAATARPTPMRMERLSTPAGCGSGSGSVMLVRASWGNMQVLLLLSIVRERKMAVNRQVAVGRAKRGRRRTRYGAEFRYYWQSECAPVRSAPCWAAQSIKAAGGLITF